MPTGLPEGKKAGWPLFCLLVGAFGVRLTGITYGLPLDLVPDEFSMIAGALKMLAVKSLIPTFHPVDEFKILYYPPLISYFYVGAFVPVLGLQFVLGGFTSLVEFKGYLVDHPETIWLTARFLQVCFGTATVYLVYRIGTMLAGKRLGIISATLLGLSFNHVLLSHFGKHWVVATFFMVLGLCIVLSDPTLKRYPLYVGAACGLAFGASIIGIFAWVYVLPIYAYLNRKDGLRLFFSRELWLNLIVGGLITGFFIALHWHYFHWLLSKGSDSQGAYISWDQTKTMGSYLVTFVEAVTILFKQETPLFVASTVGIGFMVARRCFAPLAGVGILIVIYLSYLYVFVHFESRYILVLLPPLALVGGYGLTSLMEFSRPIARRAAFVGLVVLFAGSGLAVGRLDYLLLQPDTRLQARGWIQQNAQGALVLLNSGTSGVRVVRSKAALLSQKEYGELSSSARTRLAALDLKGGQVEEGFFAVNLTEWEVSKRTLQSVDSFLKRYGKPAQPVYYVVNYWTPNTLTDVDRTLINRGKLVQVFLGGVGAVHLTHDFSSPLTIMFSMERLGMTVEIYEIEAV